MSRSGVAKQTVEIIQRGSYVAPSGRTVDVRAAIDAAVRDTVLYKPEDLVSLGVGEHPMGAIKVGQRRPSIAVTEETTAAAARRLIETEGATHVVALNFASAKNPGGGFLGGAKAQEEDLARCSALYGCLLTQPEYYATHRASPSMLYTDHIIYSPDVPFFRDEDGALLETPFLLSIITSPAPNAGEALRHGQGEEHSVKTTLEARASKVLAVAAKHNHRCLVLGAWGCGVFRNDPRDVAGAFVQVKHERFRRAFDRVVFAVYDRSKDQPNLRAFKQQFEDRGQQEASPAHE